MTSSISTQGPFPHKDVFAHVMTFMKVSDFFNAACVCKLWKQFTDALAGDHSLWKVYSESKGIPMVSSKAGPRNCRSDFCVIYPMTTVSGEMMRKFFGEPVGEVPCISIDVFNKISQLDPFDSTKLQSETWEFVVEYPAVLRVLDESTPLALNKINNLVDAAFEGEAQTPTRIPLTLGNRMTLCNHPLMGKEHLPVFSFFNVQVVSQNDYCPIKVNVYYQRKKIVDETSEMPYPQQEAFIKEIGLSVIPLGPIVLSYGVQILSSGACSDDNNSFARTSSSVSYGGKIYQSCIGGFAPPGGVDIRSSHFDVDNFGVAVSIPAEAL
jgi:hypothetical protein